MQLARFTVAFWCVLIAALLPLACAALARACQSVCRASQPRGSLLSKPPCLRGFPKPPDFASHAQAKGNSAAISTHQ